MKKIEELQQEIEELELALVRGLISTDDFCSMYHAISQNIKKLKSLDNTQITELGQLVGKTIVKAEIPSFKNMSDTPYLVLHFSDNTQAIIEADYGGYDGKARDEYPCYIDLVKSFREDELVK